MTRTQPAFTPVTLAAVAAPLLLLALNMLGFSLLLWRGGVLSPEFGPAGDDLASFAIGVASHDLGEAYRWARQGDTLFILVGLLALGGLSLLRLRWRWPLVPLLAVAVLEYIENDCIDSAVEAAIAGTPIITPPWLLALSLCKLAAWFAAAVPIGGALWRQGRAGR